MDEKQEKIKNTQICPYFGSLIPYELQVSLQPLREKNEFLGNSIVPTIAQLKQPLSPAVLLLLLSY